MEVRDARFRRKRETAEAQEARPRWPRCPPPTSHRGRAGALDHHLSSDGESRSRGRIESEPALVAPPRWGPGLEDSDRRRPLVVLDLEDFRGQLPKPVDVVELISWALGTWLMDIRNTLQVAPK